MLPGSITSTRMPGIPGGNREASLLSRGVPASIRALRPSGVRGGDAGAMLVAWRWRWRGHGTPRSGYARGPVGERMAMDEEDGSGSFEARRERDCRVLHRQWHRAPDPTAGLRTLDAPRTPGPAGLDRGDGTRRTRQCWGPAGGDALGSTSSDRDASRRVARQLVVRDSATTQRRPTGGEGGGVAAPSAADPHARRGQQALPRCHLTFAPSPSRATSRAWKAAT